MPGRRDITISLLSPDPFTTPDIGRRIFMCLQDSLPAYMPHKYGNYEPLKYKVLSGSIDEFLWAWKFPFLWNAEKDAAEGSIFMKGGHTHSNMTVSGRSKAIDTELAPRFLQNMALQAPIDYAYVHLFTEAEYAAKPQDIAHIHTLGAAAPRLRKYIPDMSWGTVWGRPYIEFFGRDVLLTAPAYLAREVTDEAIYVQLSKSILDLKSDYAAVDAVREQVKKHLGRDAFFQPDLGPTYKYMTPHLF